MARDASRLTPARRRAVDRLLAEYLDHDAERRGDYLDRCRRRYPRLARWLERLTDGDRTISLLDDSVRRLAGAALEQAERGLKREPLVPGRRLGPWQVDEIVGEGGMGMVYKGRRADDAFEMTVAIKLIGRTRPGLGELLRSECRLLARLDHPSVTRLMDAGIDEKAGPFLVMEWVEGRDLDRWLGDKQPGLDARLDLFDQLAAALAHAHQRLVVHGDIKPDNIRIRDDGRAKLLDFGVARLLADDADERPFALTPAYAAPELLRGETVSTRSDIWSLGALLAWLTDEAAADLSPTRRRELRAIADKACAADPDARYESVAGLRADLRRFRSGHPVQAMPATRRYVARRFVTRNAAGVAIAALFILVGLAGVAGVAWQAEQTQREAERALAASERTTAVKEFLVDMLAEANPFVRPGEPPTVRDLLDHSRETIAGEFADQPDIAAELLGVVGASYVGLEERDLAAEALAEALELIEAGQAPHISPAEVAEMRYDYAYSVTDGETRRQQIRLALEAIEGLENVDDTRARLVGFVAYNHLMAGETEPAVERARESAALACRNEDQPSSICVVAMSDLYYFEMRGGTHERAFEAAEQGYRMAEALYADAPHPDLIAAGYARGEALIDDRRPQAAIEHLESLREITREVYGETAIHEAYLLFRLARAHRAAGEYYHGWPLLVEALDIAAAETPGQRSIPVQLNALVGMLLDLHLTDTVSEMRSRYRHALPETPPARARLQRRFNDTRLGLMSGDADTDIAALERLIAELDEESPDLGIHARLIGMTHALDRGDIAAARDWRQRLAGHELPDTMAPGHDTVLARFHLARDDSRQALEHARRARDELIARGQRTGPHLASARAALAAAHCADGDSRRGKALAGEVRAYWREAVGHVPESVAARLPAECG